LTGFEKYDISKTYLEKDFEKNTDKSVLFYFIKNKKVYRGNEAKCTPKRYFGISK